MRDLEDDALTELTAPDMTLSKVRFCSTFGAKLLSFFCSFTSTSFLRFFSFSEKSKRFLPPEIDARLRSFANSDPLPDFFSELRSAETVDPFFLDDVLLIIQLKTARVIDGLSAVAAVAFFLWPVQNRPLDHTN